MPNAFAQSDASSLRWVRGRVIATTPTTVTLQLRGDNQLSIACEARCAVATPGALAEIHDVDKKGQRRAEHVFAGTRVDGELSKKPGRSVHGVLSRTRKSSVQLLVGTKKRTFRNSGKDRPRRQHSSGRQHHSWHGAEGGRGPPAQVASVAIPALRARPQKCKYFSPGAASY